MDGYDIRLNEVGF